MVVAVERTSTHSPFGVTVFIDISDLNVLLQLLFLPNTPDYTVRLRGPTQAADKMLKIPLDWPTKQARARAVQ